MKPAPRPVGRPANIERNAEILALRGAMKREAIASKLGVSIGVVSGVCFRAARPRSPRSRFSHAERVDAQ